MPFHFLNTKLFVQFFNQPGPPLIQLSIFSSKNYDLPET